MNKTEPEKSKFQPAGRVKIVKGSILTPENAGLRFVLNVANLVGKAESPLYPLFDKKWPTVKKEVKGWFNTRTGAYKLGAVASLAVQSDTWVLSMLCKMLNLIQIPKLWKPALKKFVKQLNMRELLFMFLHC